MYCKLKKKCCWDIINCDLTPHNNSVFFFHFLKHCGQQSISFTELLLFPSVSQTASTRYHVKLLWEQLKLCSIPLLLFLTSGDTVTVDLSSPIMEEVSHFCTPGCQPSFQSQYFSLKLAILREIKSWRIEQHHSQIAASLTTLQTTFQTVYGVFLLIVAGCSIALGKKGSFEWLVRYKMYWNYCSFVTLMAI